MFAFDWDSVTGEVKRSAGADRVLHMSGGSEHDSGRAYLRRIHKQDRQRYHDIIVALTPDKPEYELRYTLRRDDGSDVVLQERGRAYFDAGGQMTKVLGMSADVTAHARMEQALHEQEAEFRQIANSAPAILWITDQRGAVRFVSSSWHDFTGQIEADALGTGWLNVVHPEDREAVRARYDDDLRQRREIIASYRLRRADGSYSWVLDRARARHSAAGELIGYVGSTMDVSEQKRIEVELQQSRQRLGLALAAGRMGTFEWDLRDGSLTVDAVQAELIGSDPATRSLEGVLDRVLPEDRSGVDHAIAQALQRGDYQHEFRVRPGDGSVRWLAGRGGLRRDESGSPQALVGVTWDVTARKEQEAQLRRSEERLRNTVESAQIGIAYGDSTGAILDCNDSLRRMLALLQPGPTHAPLAWSTFFSPQDERLSQAVEAVARGESVGPMEVTLRRTDGGPLEALWSMVPLRHEPGAHVAMLVDLRELKSAQRQAHESARFSARISDIVPALLYVYDTQRQSALYCNRHAAQVVGYSPEEMLGMGGEFLVRMLHPEDLDRFQAHVAGLEDAGEGESRTLEYRMRHRDGSWRWILGRESVLLRDPAGRVLQVMGAAADVTELKRAEHALREADRRKDEYLAILAHELRNPLAPIRNAANILGLAQPSEAQSKWARELIARQVDQLARLIDDLLDVSRISRGKLVLRKEPTTLAAVIESAAESCAPIIARHGHTLRTHLPPTPVPLLADLVRMAQVFVNLLSNAAKYTPHGGQIDVTAQREGEDVVVRVRDNGIGIPPEKLPYLFEIFYQVDSSLERAHGGLGIGLTLVERLLHLHGGSVSASSAGIGRGSEFVVRLPVLDGGAQAVQPTVGPPRAAPTGRRVVVADDNADSAESLALLLRMNGDEVFVAFDGQAALDLIEAHAPDVALLDIGMPRLNGYDVARRARALPAAEGMLLVALTGWGQAEDVRRSLDAGFDVHLTKPLDFARLSALLDQRAAPASP
jgi:PAS domain S-box-containing protein